MTHGARRRLFSFVFGCVLVLSADVSLAASGHVVDAEGKPVKGARACLVVGGAEGLCSVTDENGYYGLPDSQVPWVRITASGFLAKQVAAVDQDTPIPLDRAASLLVRLVDRETGAPLANGQVFVIYPSGSKKGPFPTNAAGVHVSSLEPGEVVIQGSAPGHLEDRSETQSLRNGNELSVVLKLPSGTKEP